MVDRQDPQTFAQLASQYSADVASLAHAARKLIIDRLPGVYEIVWPVIKVAGYGTGPKKMSEHFTWLSMSTKHVTFGFYYGAELPDPAQLLEGTGATMRHVKIRSPADLANTALHALIDAALKHRVPPLREGPDADADLADARAAALSGPAKKAAASAKASPSSSSSAKRAKKSAKGASGAKKRAPPAKKRAQPAKKSAKAKKKSAKPAKKRR